MVDLEAAERGGEVFGLLPAQFGQLGVVNAAAVGCPRRLGVADEEEFHRWGAYGAPLTSDPVLAAGGGDPAVVAPTPPCRSARWSAVTGLPAAPVPVTAVVGSQAGDGHHVAGPGRDVPIAARTEVALRRLVGLHEPHIDLPAVSVMLHVHRTGRRRSRGRGATSGGHTPARNLPSLRCGPSAAVSAADLNRGAPRG